MSICFLKIRLSRFTPNAISPADTNVSFLYGDEPFKLKSYSVKVSDGKCLKKDKRTLEKFSSPSRLLLVQLFIFSATVPGKRMGVKKSNNNMLATEMPVILNTFRINRFMPQ